MNRKTFGLTFVSALFALVLAFDANAWMDPWAPVFKAAPASVQALSRTSVSNYVCNILGDEFRWKYSEFVTSWEMSSGGSIARDTPLT